MRRVINGRLCACVRVCARVCSLWMTPPTSGQIGAAEGRGIVRRSGRDTEDVIKVVLRQYVVYNLVSILAVGRVGTARRIWGKGGDGIWYRIGGGGDDDEVVARSPRCGCCEMGCSWRGREVDIGSGITIVCVPEPTVANTYRSMYPLRGRVYLRQIKTKGPLWGGEGVGWTG